MPESIFQGKNKLWRDQLERLWENGVDPKDIILVTDLDLSLLPKLNPNDPDDVSFTRIQWKIFQKLTRNLGLVCVQSARGPSIEAVFHKHEKALGPLNMLLCTDSGYTARVLGKLNKVDLRKLLGPGSSWQREGDSYSRPVENFTLEKQKALVEKINKILVDFRKQFTEDHHVTEEDAPLLRIDKRGNLVALIHRIKNTELFDSFRNGLTKALEAVSGEVGAAPKDYLSEDKKYVLGYTDVRVGKTNKGVAFTELAKRLDLITPKTVLIIVGDSAPDKDLMDEAKKLVKEENLLTFSVGEGLKDTAKTTLRSKLSKTPFYYLYQFFRDLNTYAKLCRQHANNLDQTRTTIDRRPKPDRSTGMAFG